MRLSRCLRALRDELNRLDEVSGSIRVIDNGSTDRTPEVVDEVNRAAPGAPLTVPGCAHPGEGSAGGRGMVTSAADWVGFCAADLATPASALADAVGYQRDGWQVAVGSRSVEGARRIQRRSPVRRAGGLGFRLLTSNLVPDVHDTQCGFKFFQGAVVRRLFAHAHPTGFAFDVEILARAAQLGMSIKEMPVIWTDSEHSTLPAPADGPKILRELTALRRRLRTSLAVQRPAVDVG